MSIVVSNGELGEVVTLIRGVTYNKKDTSDVPGEGFVPLLRATNIEEDELSFDECVYVPSKVVAEDQMLRPGDIVMATSSGSSRVVGKSAPLRDSWEGTFGAFCTTLRPKPGINPRWAALVAQSPRVRRHLSALASGTSINNLKREHLLTAPIAIAPLDGQNEIVARLDPLLETIRSSLAEVRSSLRQAAALREKTLSAAFSTDWPRLPFGDVARVEANLVSPAKYQNKPHIAPNHIESKTGRLLEYTTVAEDGVKSQKHLFKPGQILYSKIRPYLAKAVLVDFEGLCSADMYPISTTLDNRFLLYWMLSPDFTALAAGEQGRSVLPKINKKQLAGLDVPVPEAGVQSATADAIEDSLARLDGLVEEVQGVAAYASALRAALLTHFLWNSADHSSADGDLEPQLAPVGVVE